jgi:hypothetical protein
VAQAFFKVRLTIQPKGGDAELVTPKVLEDVTWRFAVIKEGGEEGIVTVEGSNAAIANVAKDPACTKLTKDTLETALKAYPTPKLKKKFRPAPSGPPDTVGGGPVPMDEKGNRIVDTVQSVRAGFYIIDVPVVPPS